jgi:hypothetical protein
MSDEFDTPLDTQEDIDQPNSPAYPPVQVEGEADTARRNVQAALVRDALEKAQLPLQTYQEAVKDPVGQVNFTEATKTAFETEQAAHKAQTEGMLLGIKDPNTATNYIDFHRQQLAGLGAEYATTSGPNATYVKNVNNFPIEYTPEQHADYVARLTLSDKLAEESASIGAPERVRDVIAQVAFPPKMLKDAFDLTGEISPTGAYNYISNMIDYFQGLTPEEKIAQWPHIQATVEDAMPRDRAISVLAAFLDPSRKPQLQEDFELGGYINYAGTALALLGVAAGARRSFSPLRQMSGMNRMKDGGTLAAETVIDPSTGKSRTIYTTRESAMNSVVPFKGVDSNATPDLSAAAQEQLLKYQGVLSQNEKDITNSESFVNEGILNRSERIAQVTRFDAEFEQQLTALREQAKIAGVEFDPTNIQKKIMSHGIDFTFDWTDPSGEIKQGTFQRNFTMNQVGDWIGNSNTPDVPDMSGFKGKGMSPYSISIGTGAQQDVEAVLRIDLAQNGLKTKMRKMYVGVVRDLKGDSTAMVLAGNGKTRAQKIREVDEVLKLGDQIAHVYTPFELSSGINGYKFSEDQIVTYLKARRFYDSLFNIRNNSKVRDFDSRGVMTIFHGKKPIGFGEVRLTADEARKQLRMNPQINQIINLADRNKNVDRSWLLQENNLNEAYAMGYRVVKFEEPIMALGGRRFTHAIVKLDNLRRRPEIVLHKHEGYITRINPDANYIVKITYDSPLDGVPALRFKTKRTFTTDAEAQAYAAELRNDLEVGKTIGVMPEGRYKGVSVTSDNTGVNAKYLRPDGGGSPSDGHGLIFGPRADERPPHGPEAANPPALGAFESLKMYMESTNAFVTRNEWRMGMRQRWVNTLRKMMGNEEAPVTFENYPKTAAGPIMEAWHQQIELWSGWTDKGEDWWDNRVLKLYEWAVNPESHSFSAAITKPFLGPIAYPAMRLMRHRDPFAAIRSATFHTTLGMYNPIQFFVQSQGGAIAAASNLFHPLKLAGLLRQGFALRWMQYVPRDSKAIELMARAQGLDPKEMRAMQALWDKTGLYDSIMSSADVDAAAKGYPMTQGMFRNLMQGGLVFYREGELFSRALSFVTAVEENGGALKILGDHEAEKDTLTRTSNYMFNLQRSNAAPWQTGALSLWSQFFQITAKAMENIIGPALGTNKSPFTKLERFRMGLMQILLYGGAGMPIGIYVMKKSAANAGLNKMSENDPRLKPMIDFINGGLWDITLHALGIDATFGERGSIANGFDQTILSLFTDDRGPKWAPFMGASGTLAGRIADVWHNVGLFWKPTNDVSYNGEQFSPLSLAETIKYMMTDVGGQVIKLTSAGNQERKAYFMREYNTILSRRDAPIVIQDFDTATEIAAAIGFEPQAQRDAITLRAINQSYDDYITERTDDMMHLYGNAMREIMGAWGQNEQNLPQERYDFLRQRIEGAWGLITDDQDREAVSKQLKDRLIAPQSQEDKEVQRYMHSAPMDIAKAFGMAKERIVIPAEIKSRQQ